MPSGMIRVLIVHDDPSIRRSLAQSLVLAEGLDVELVGVAATGEAALALLEQVHPDVILLGLLLPDMDGVRAVQELHAIAPAVKIMVLTTFAEGERLQEALQAGACGYGLTDLVMELPLDLIRLVVRGKASPNPGRGPIHRSGEPLRPTRGEALTEREREVLALVVQGFSHEAIAERLVMTPATVKFHLRNIRTKRGTSGLS